MEFNREVLITKHQSLNFLSNHFRFFKCTCSKSKFIILFGTTVVRLVMEMRKQTGIK
jgi:hypothetical protein